MFFVLTWAVSLNAASYYQTADGSAGAVLDNGYLLNFDDESNIARVYRADVSAKALKTFDLTHALRLEKEADFEAAERSGDTVYLITSHGRNKSGKLRPDRYRFATLSISGTIPSLDLRVTGYTASLLHHMVDGSRWRHPDAAIIATLKERSQLGRKKVSHLAPKVNGTNIEGLSALPGTSALAIGFRNPQYNNKAIVVTLENPSQTASEAVARFGEAILLDLDGLGIRAMTYSAFDHRVYIIAGSASSKTTFALYSWSGRAADDAVFIKNLPAKDGVSPEAIIAEAAATVRIYNDEGTRNVDGNENKALPMHKQYFTDFVISTAVAP